MIISYGDNDTEKLANLPVTPGELLNEEFILPMGITKYKLAKAIGVPPQRIGDVVLGKRSITADTDLRLCKYFGLSTGYWLRAQARYDSLITREKIKDQLEKIIPLTQKATLA
jgi:addiction module HigA family antidote